MKSSTFSNVRRTVRIEIGRGERIRTSGPCLPKTVLYQAELLPDRAPGRMTVRCRASGLLAVGLGMRKRRGSAARAFLANRSMPDELLARGFRARGRDSRPPRSARQSSKLVGSTPRSASRASRPCPARACRRRSRRHCGGDLLGDLIAVGPVGADRPGRPAPRPADAVEPVGDPALVVGEFPAALVIGHAVDRRGLVADAADDQARRDLIGLAGAAAPRRSRRARSARRSAARPGRRLRSAPAWRRSRTRSAWA